MVWDHEERGGHVSGLEVESFPKCRLRPIKSEYKRKHGRQQYLIKILQSCPSVMEEVAEVNQKLGQSWDLEGQRSAFGRNLRP